MGFKIFDFLNRNQQDKYDKRIARLYKEVFNSDAGQEVLADLIMHSHVLESTEGDLIKEGCRKGTLRILGILNYDPKKLQKMTKKMTSVEEELEDEDE